MLCSAFRSISNFTPKVGEKDTQRAIRQAFNVWQTVTPLSFQVRGKHMWKLWENVLTYHVCVTFSSLCIYVLKVSSVVNTQSKIIFSITNDSKHKSRGSVCQHLFVRLNSSFVRLHVSHRKTSCYHSEYIWYWSRCFLQTPAALYFLFSAFLPLRSGGPVLRDQEWREGGWHHDLLRLRFPWWQLSLWWRGRFPGPCLLPWRRHWRGHTLWLWWALDAGKRQPRWWAGWRVSAFESLCCSLVSQTTEVLFGLNLFSLVMCVHGKFYLLGQYF